MNHVIEHNEKSKNTARNKNARYALGRFGERMCAHVLQCRGYEILARNYKVIGGEVDIICCKGYNLVFVEVKTWEYYTEADITESVDMRKLSRICACADAYIAAGEYNVNTWTCIRVDVMLVQASRNIIIHYKGVL